MVMAKSVRNVITLILLVLAAALPASAQPDTTGTLTTGRLRVGSPLCILSSGSGSPEGSVVGKPCDIYLRSGATITTVYIKESGSGTNTGWVAVEASRYPFKDATQTITGSWTFTGGLTTNTVAATFNSASIFTGTATFGNTLTSNGNATFNLTLTASGASTTNLLGQVNLQGITGGIAGTTTISRTTPIFQLYDSDAAANEKYARLFSEAGITWLDLVNDAYSDSRNVFQIDRTGMQPDYLRVWPQLIVGGYTYPDDTGLAFGNVRMGINAIGGNPRIILQPVNATTQVTMDAVADPVAGGSTWRLFRTQTSNGACPPGPGCVPLFVDDLINVDPRGKSILPVLPYDINIGAPFKKFLSLYAAELNVETLVAQETMATIGGRILVGPTTYLVENLAALATTVKVRHNNLNNGDRVHLEADGKVEFMAVTSAATKINRCTSNCQFELGSVAGWASDGPGAMFAFDQGAAYKGNYSGVVPPGEANAYHCVTGTDHVAGATHTVSIVISRDDQVPVAPVAGGQYRIYIDSILYDSQVENLGNNFFRVWATGVAGNPLNSDCAGILLPVGYPGNHFVDALQIELGSTLTPYSEVSSSYTVTRNLEASANNPWEAGSAVFNTGQTGNGFIDIYSTRGVRAGTEIGPTIVGNIRQSLTYNDWKPCWALGNLQGIYGYGAGFYGLALGCYQGNSWITMEPTNGIVFTERVSGVDHINAQIHPGLGFIIGRLYETNSPYVQITSTALSMCVAGVACRITMNGTTGDIDLTGNLTVGTAGAIKSGATAFGTGTGYWLAHNAGTPQFRVGIPSSKYMQWDGSQVDIKTAQFQLNDSGLKINVASGQPVDDPFAIQWIGGLGLKSYLQTYESGSTRTTILGAGVSAGNNATLLLSAFEGGAGPSVQVKAITSGSWAVQMVGVGGSSVTYDPTGGINYFYPSPTAAVRLGKSGNVWGDLWSVVSTTTADFDPIVTDAATGQFLRKTNGTTQTTTCAGGQALKSFTIHSGIVITATCGVP